MYSHYLTELDLEDNPIGDLAAGEILEALKNRQLGKFGAIAYGETSHRTFQLSRRASWCQDARLLRNKQRCFYTNNKVSLRSVKEEEERKEKEKSEFICGVKRHLVSSKTV